MKSCYEEVVMVVVRAAVVVMALMMMAQGNYTRLPASSCVGYMIRMDKDAA